MEFPEQIWAGECALLGMVGLQTYFASLSPGEASLSPGELTLKEEARGDLAYPSWAPLEQSS